MHQTARTSASLESFFHERVRQQAVDRLLTRGPAPTTHQETSAKLNFELTLVLPQSPLCVYIAAIQFIRKQAILRFDCILTLFSKIGKSDNNDAPDRFPKVDLCRSNPAWRVPFCVWQDRACCEFRQDGSYLCGLGGRFLYFCGDEFVDESRRCKPDPRLQH